MKHIIFIISINVYPGEFLSPLLFEIISLISLEYREMEKEDNKQVFNVFSSCYVTAENLWIVYV